MEIQMKRSKTNFERIESAPSSKIGRNSLCVCEEGGEKERELPPLATAVWAKSRWTAATGIPLLLVPRLLRGNDGIRDKRLVLPNVAVGVVKFSVLVLAGLVLVLCFLVSVVLTLAFRWNHSTIYQCMRDDLLALFHVSNAKAMDENRWKTNNRNINKCRLEWLSIHRHTHLQYNMIIII